MAVDRGVIFSEATAKRIGAAVRRIEKQSYDFRKGSQRATLSPTPGIIEAISTSAITPFNANTNTYGQGSCQPQISKFNSNTNSYLCIPDPSFSSSLVLNRYVNNGNSVAAGKAITVSWRNGNFLLVGADC